jgi:hypothetical protein
MHGKAIFSPPHVEQRPQREMLSWHQTNKFLG